MPDERDWWRNAVVYQIYPRSFSDSDGDGVGDIPGIIRRVPYLKALNIDAVWLSPFYPSPLADGGYDVVDHRAVDDALGTMQDFRDLLAALHEAGLRLIIDIVPNHSSERHPWFVEALRSPPGSAARDRYVFRAGSGPDGDRPPTDWRSHFGGSAWTRVPDGEWYLHLFAAEQPDFDWTHADVRDDFMTTLRFWSDLGVDGFRIDVAHALAKDLTEPLRSQPDLDLRLPLDGTDPLYDRNELTTIYGEWRSLFDEYDPPRMAVAETAVPRSRRHRYAHPESLGQAFNFDLINAEWDAAHVREIVQGGLEEASISGATTTWVLSSHDIVRHASRLGLDSVKDADAWLLRDGVGAGHDPAVGLDRARALTLLMLALPGSAYLYQGEELGLPEVADLPWSALADPVATRSRGALKGRDGARVPLPWSDSGPSYGFSAAEPWLPQPPGFADLSVERQDRDERSTLWLYRNALELRRRLLVDDEEVAWQDGADDVVHLTRSGGFHSVTNFGRASIPLPRDRRDLITSGRDLDGHRLPPTATVWFQSPSGRDRPARR